MTDERFQALVKQADEIAVPFADDKAMIFLSVLDHLVQNEFRNDGTEAGALRTVARVIATEFREWL